MTAPLTHDHQTDHAANQRGCWMYGLFLVGLLIVLWSALIGAGAYLYHLITG